MDSLKTIQKTFRIFLRLTHAAIILCIVGAVLSGNAHSLRSSSSSP